LEKEYRIDTMPLKKALTETFFTASLLIVTSFVKAESARPDTLTNALKEVSIQGESPLRPAVGIPGLRTTLEGLRESGERSVFQALSDRIPGFFVTEKGILGYGVSASAAGQISLRGMGGSPTTGVLVLMDGIPQIMGIFGHPFADTDGTATADRVEVYRGPASLRFGSNAVGGAIDIHTPEAEKNGFSGEARLDFGRFSTRDFAVQSGWRSSKWNVWASYQDSRTDGHRPHSDFGVQSGVIRANYAWNRAWHLESILRVSAYTGSDPGPDTLNAQPGITLNVQRGTASVLLEHRGRQSDSYLRLYHDRGTHDLSDGFRSHDRTSGGSIGGTIAFSGGGRLRVGADVQRYGGEAFQRTLSQRLVDTTLSEGAVYALYSQPIVNQLRLTAGLRWQKHESYPAEWIPSIGIESPIHQGLLWKASAGKGLRNPTLRERFLWNHNKTLVPERIWNCETSLIQLLEPFHTRLEVTAFHWRGTNRIVYGFQGKPYNTGRVQTSGLEVAASMQPSSVLKAYLNYAGLLTQTPTYGSPRNHLSLGGSYSVGRVRIESGFRWIEHLRTSPTLSDRASFQTYGLWNMRLQWKLNPRLEVGLKGENLLNRTFETIRYYPMPGRILTGSLRYRLNV
jgi:iron complex outermembrane receptor protein